MNEYIVFDILTILGKIIKKDPSELSHIPRTTPLSDLGVGSIEFIYFIVEIERFWNIEILDSDLLLSKFNTIENLLKTLSKYIPPIFQIKKVLICDCDGVLWNGIAGEDNIYLDYKNILLHAEICNLIKHGVLVCLCSKNSKKNIVDAFTNLNISICLDDIILLKSDSHDKAKDIMQISTELNLSTNSFVFLDDSSFEVDYVKNCIPDIVSIKANYHNGIEFFSDIKQLFSLNTNYNIERIRQYKEEKERKKIRSNFTKIDEYNKFLNTTIVCEFAEDNHLDRIAELSQRTHKFNMSQKRYSAQQLHNLNLSNYDIIYIAASDKYGDMGIVGGAIVSCENTIVIENMFLSCRILDRNFENIFIDKIKKIYNKTLYGIYKYSNETKEYVNFYKDNGVILYE